MSFYTPILGWVSLEVTEAWLFQGIPSPINLEAALDLVLVDSSSFSLLAAPS